MRRLRTVKRPPGYPEGTCTEFAYRTTPWVPLGWGDAAQWPASALAAGLIVCDHPLKNGLAVWPQGREHGPYGHVAPVVDVEDDGAFTVWEASPGTLVPGRDRHYGPGASAWFIHPPAHPYTRLPDGVFGAGRGAAPDPIDQVVTSWDGLVQYWNQGAPRQSINLELVVLMLAQLGR